MLARSGTPIHSVGAPGAQSVCWPCGHYLLLLFQRNSPLMSREYDQVKHSQRRNAARWLFPTLCTILYAVTVLNSQPNTAREQSVAVAKKVAGPLDADGFPAGEQWSLA